MYCKSKNTTHKCLQAAKFIALLVLTFALFTSCNAAAPSSTTQTTEKTEEIETIPSKTEASNSENIEESTVPSDNSDMKNDTIPEESVEVEEVEVEEPEEAITPEEAILSVGEMTTLGDWEITLNSYEVTDSIKATYGSFSPDEGNKYVSVELTIKNIGTTADTFLPSFSFGNKDISAKIKYQEKYEYTASNLLAHDSDLHDKTTNPLSSLTGIIAFEIIEEAAISDELTFVLTLGKDEVIYNLK